MRNPGNSEVYYQYLQSDAAGRMTQQWLGDGSTLNQAYQAHSNRITSQHTTLGGAGIQQLSYAWDSSGNMSSRSDLLNGLSESFTYDNLDRLTAAQVGAATAKDYGYSIVGNLIEKSDVGDYSYNLVQPHAVGQISQGGNTNDYAYDTNGNLNSGDDLPSLTWASYNKPTQIQKNGITYNFKYGPDRLRYQKTHSSGGTTTTTHYLGNFEQSNDGTTTQYRHHIRAGERVIAVLTDDGGNTELKYLHRDHLGSITAITDDTGNLIERLSYGPWGQRRSATDWETIITTATDHRGYTGHEHLDDVGLIHMNGRIYTPKLGRMLSPDPVTQEPENGQNYNRYSYAMNNPLKYTDPSGYFSLTISIGNSGNNFGIGVEASPGYGSPCLFGMCWEKDYNSGTNLWKDWFWRQVNSFQIGGQIASPLITERRQPGFNATPDASGTQGVVGESPNFNDAVNQTISAVKSKFIGVNGRVKTLDSGSDLGAYVRINEEGDVIHPNFNEISQSAARGKNPTATIWNGEDPFELPENSVGLVIVPYGKHGYTKNIEVNTEYYNGISDRIGGLPVYVVSNSFDGPLFEFQGGQKVEYENGGLP